MYRLLRSGRVQNRRKQKKVAREETNSSHPRLRSFDLMRVIISVACQNDILPVYILIYILHPKHECWFFIWKLLFRCYDYHHSDVLMYSCRNKHILSVATTYILFFPFFSFFYSSVHLLTALFGANWLEQIFLLWIWLLLSLLSIIIIMMIITEKNMFNSDDDSVWRSSWKHTLRLSRPYVTSVSWEIYTDSDPDNVWLPMTCDSTVQVMHPTNCVVCVSFKHKTDKGKLNRLNAFFLC